MKVLFTLILLGISVFGFSQDKDMFEDAVMVKEMRIKNASTYLYYDSLRQPVDSILHRAMLKLIGGIDSIEVSTFNFDIEGNIILKRTLNPFIRKPLLEEFIFEYNADGQLILELTYSTRVPIVASSIQVMLDNLVFQKDSSFYLPDSTFYLYDSNKRLIRKDILNYYYLASKYLPTSFELEYNENGDLTKSVFKDNQLPYAHPESRDEVVYTYDEAYNLIHERHSTMGYRETYFTHSIHYDYNPDGMLVKETTRTDAHGYKTNCFYNKGKLICLEKYEYGSWDDIDSNVRYNGDKVTWYEKISYSYDLMGNLIQETLQKSKDDIGLKIVYTYNAQNLLILKELIKNGIPLSYKTFYSYY